MKNNIKFKTASIVLFSFLIFNFSLINARGMGNLSEDGYSDYEDEYIIDDIGDEDESAGYFDFYFGYDVKDPNFSEKERELCLKNFLQTDNYIYLDKKDYLSEKLDRKELLKKYIESSFESYINKQDFVKNISIKDDEYKLLCEKINIYKDFFIKNFVVEFIDNDFFEIKIKKSEEIDSMLKISGLVFDVVCKKEGKWEEIWQKLTAEEKCIYEIFLHVRAFIKFFNGSLNDEDKYVFISNLYEKWIEDFKNFEKNEEDLYSDMKRFVMNEGENNGDVVNSNFGKISFMEGNSSMEDEIFSVLRDFDSQSTNYGNILKKFKDFESFDEYVEFAKSYFLLNLPRDEDFRKDGYFLLNLLKDGNFCKDIEFLKQIGIHPKYRPYFLKYSRYYEYPEEKCETASVEDFLLFYFSKYLSYVLNNVIVPDDFKEKSFKTRYSKNGYDKVELNFLRKHPGFKVKSVSEVQRLADQENGEQEVVRYYGLLNEYRQELARKTKEATDAVKSRLKDYEEIFLKKADDFMFELENFREALVRSCVFKNKNGIYEVKFKLPKLIEDDEIKNLKEEEINHRNEMNSLYGISGKLLNKDVRNYIYKFLKLFELCNGKGTSNAQLELLDKKYKCIYNYFLFVLGYIKAFNMASCDKGFLQIPYEFFGFRYNFNFRSFNMLCHVANMRNMQKKVKEKQNIEKQIIAGLYEKDCNEFFNFMLDKSLNVKVYDEIKRDADIYSLTKKENLREMFDKNITSNFDHEFDSLKDYLSFAKYYINKVKKNPSKTYLQCLFEKSDNLYYEHISKGKGIKDLYADEVLINSFHNYLTYVINFLLAPVGFENKEFFNSYVDKKVGEFKNKEKDEERILDYKKYLENRYEEFLQTLKANREFLLDIRNFFVRNCFVKRGKDGFFHRIVVNQNPFLKDLKKIIDIYNENLKQLDLRCIEHRNKLAYRFFLFARAYVKLLNYRFAKYKCEIPYLDYSEAVDGFNMNSQILSNIALVRKNKKDRLLKIRELLKEINKQRGYLKK